MLTAIIVAAGSSRRMGFDKLFAELAKKPVFVHAVTAFENTSSVLSIVIVARADRHKEIEKIVRDQSFKKIQAIVPGGEHRQDSVRAGLHALPDATEHVAVHDAARPLITPEQIERVYEVAKIHHAAALAEPATDTLKHADADLFVSGTVDREKIFAMQTPQIFDRKLLEQAYQKIFDQKISVTDEVSAIEHAGGKIMLVPNDRPNFKITYPDDLALAEFVLNQRTKTR